jgi:hypothetical protein
LRCQIKDAIFDLKIMLPNTNLFGGKFCRDITGGIAKTQRPWTVQPFD